MLLLHEQQYFMPDIKGIMFYVSNIGFFIRYAYKVANRNIKITKIQLLNFAKQADKREMKIRITYYKY